MRVRAVGIVREIVSERHGTQEIRAQIFAPVPSQEEQNDSVSPKCTEELRAAIVYPELTGSVKPGDRVLLNTVAMELQLGTGGYDFVIAVLDNPAEEKELPGHILKLRYTPLQLPVLSVEAQESPHHDALKAFESLDEMPVVCMELHSQLPAICAAAKWAGGRCTPSFNPRIVYIMTDGAALPLALSKIVPALREKGLLDVTITAGQAFGGDYEAVNLYSALSAAQVVAKADIVVVGQGPGTTGTGTPLGFSGVDQGMAINAADSLGGVPVAVARISFAEKRKRHLGLSHHTVTVLTRIAQAAALVPIPRLPETQRRQLAQALRQSGIAAHHQPITVDADGGLEALEATGLNVTTMGRDLSTERPFFLSAAAAGLLASQLVEAKSL